MIQQKGILRGNLLALILLSLLAVSSNDIQAEGRAEARRYQASLHEAGWEIGSSVFECRLSQAIPRYGEVHFQHRAGESLEFQLQAFSDLLGGDTLSLRSVPPPWNYQRDPKEFGTLNFTSDDQPLSLDTVMARKLMGEMLTGMMPTFEGVANYDDSQSVSIIVSPLHFQSAYSEYQKCSGKLLPVNFEQVQRSTIFWKSSASDLDNSSRSMLDNIVLYAQADPSVYALEVDSFTDTAGERRENLLISEERAFKVTNYMVSRGLNPEMIATRAHGEREEYLIVNPETSHADRDRNRRVNIVLLRN